MLKAFLQLFRRPKRPALGQPAGHAYLKFDLGGGKVACYLVNHYRAAQGETGYHTTVHPVPPAECPPNQGFTFDEVAEVFGIKLPGSPPPDPDSDLVKPRTHVVD